MSLRHFFFDGDVLHQNLSTGYTNIPHLLTSLGKSGFTGTVEIDFPRLKILILVNGEHIAAGSFEENGGERMVWGEELAKEVATLATDEEGMIRVRRYPGEQVAFVLSTFDVEPAFEKLSTDFVVFDLFLKKLANEKHTGFIELISGEGKPTAFIGLEDGAVISLCTVSDTGAPLFLGDREQAGFLENIGQDGTLFNVYRKKTADGKIEEKSSQTVSGGIIPGTGEKTDGGGDKGEREEGGDPERPEPPELQEPSEDSFPPVLEDRPGNETDQGSQKEREREEVADLLSKFLGTIEQGIDASSEKGLFIRTFKRSLIEKSEIYPFLDPFEGLFDYHEGKVHLDPAVDVKELSAGIMECLNLGQVYMRKEVPKRKPLSSDMKADIWSALKGYQDLVRVYGFEGTIPLFFQ